MLTYSHLHAFPCLSDDVDNVRLGEMNSSILQHKIKSKVIPKQLDRPHTMNIILNRSIAFHKYKSVYRLTPDLPSVAVCMCGCMYVCMYVCVCV